MSMKVFTNNIFYDGGRKIGDIPVENFVGEGTRYDFHTFRKDLLFK